MNFTDPDTREDLRSRLLRRLLILSVLLAVTSLVSIVVGILAVNWSNSKFPYNAGGGIIAGIPALLLTICPCCMACDSYDVNGNFECCAITLAIWFGIMILAIPIGFGISGAYGLAACMNEAEKVKVCQENEDFKIALSIMTVIVTAILFVLALAIFFTCCCNSSTFGIPLLNEGYPTYPSQQTNVRRDVISSINRTDRNRQFQELAIQAALTEARSSEFRPRPATTANIDYPSIYEPSAPPASGDTGQWSYDDENASSVTPPTRHQTHPYADPPPSYDEVMKKDATEARI